MSEIKKINQNEKEKDTISRCIPSGYDYSHSVVGRFIIDYYGRDFNRDEFVFLARVLAEQLNIKLPREATRRKLVTLFWMDQYQERIIPFLKNHVIITDKDHVPFGRAQKVEEPVKNTHAPSE